ncbi:VWA domain-containing protein [Actinocrinis puniceicyclus]|uniref:Mg-protoporphyrin IX chelatase n=1 Tax=Actinocrinis puniceicyclus TaxID=977794 RepID=A0A8J7WU70_9ACTN|nr:VWA domain-containing protein [Actinocrinis puniceicyclus]
MLGQEGLRLALILNAIHPGVGGVLARGEKGTAKSTLVRALAAVLPRVGVVLNCRFACDPAAPDARCPDGPHQPDATSQFRRARLVELPVGASEDRLTGSLDLERALGHGVAAFQPGLLAAAHRGMLYVDEVNLLPDHLVDVLLDAAAMGVAHVERDGVSVRHAARFILVGTMNPEEGELRPQLLDRFGLAVEVAASREPRQRAEIVRRRLAYEADPAGFAAAWADADRAVGERIAAARAALGSVTLPDIELERIARVCAAFEVDGMRADLVTARAAIALAAWHGRPAVTAADVRDAARLALPHRRRRNPFDAPGLDEDKLDEALRDEDGDEPEPEPDGPGGGGVSPDAADDVNRPNSAGQPPNQQPPDRPADASTTHQQDGTTRSETGGDAPDSTGEQPALAAAATSSRPTPEQTAVAPADPYRTRLYCVPGVGEGVPGRRSAGRSTGRGRTVGAETPHRAVSSLHLPATVRAAAAHQAARGRTGGPLVLRAEDLRTPVRRDREGNLVLFVVDASGSMAARARMTAVKGAVLSLLLDAYQRRDKVGMVTFRGDGADVALPPTTSVEAAAARLRALPTGGRTPLAAGLLTAAEVVRLERLRDPRRRPLLVIVTDGRATGATTAPGGAGAEVRRAQNEVRRVASHLYTSRIASIVVDCEAGPVRLGLAARLAVELGGRHVPMADLAAGGHPDALAATVRASLDPLPPRTPLDPPAPGDTARKAA